MSVMRRQEASRKSGLADPGLLLQLDEEHEQAVEDCRAHLDEDLRLRGFAKWMTDLGKQCASEQLDLDVAKLISTSTITDPIMCHEAALLAASLRSQSVYRWDEGSDGREELRWQARPSVYHYDARRAVDVAKVPMETSGPYLRYSVTMDGYFEKVGGWVGECRLHSQRPRTTFVL